MFLFTVVPRYGHRDGDQHGLPFQGHGTAASGISTFGGRRRREADLVAAASDRRSRGSGESCRTQLEPKRKTLTLTEACLCAYACHRHVLKLFVMLQSAGKSTLLEAIANLPGFLPKGGGMQTRRPLLLRLQNDCSTQFTVATFQNPHPKTDVKPNSPVYSTGVHFMCWDFYSHCYCVLAILC